LCYNHIIIIIIIVIIKITIVIIIITIIIILIFKGRKILISFSSFKEPFLVIEDVIGTYELASCYNVTIDCRAADMVATVRTNKVRKKTAGFHIHNICGLIIYSILDF